ncbi:hypothetical protein VHEMI07604 [[Torrubiella] hemipterigena]|uniref:FAD-binding domain-containing protein n=1 Tax=[Torrubiella] hemipterigena TaxID=1531966 RepID=A0A0A1T407_9HYPO|nr:hypothetical protein VHEMI07604 [[Torrubiella] hemipterigena]
MPLNVIIIGAGIAGLTAAISLREAGHHVEVYEKSSFAAEIGAAVNLLPNGVKVLESLNFDFDRARAVTTLHLDTVNGIDMSPIASRDLHEAAKIYGAAPKGIHRVDLHRELMRLANVAEVHGPNENVTETAKSSTLLHLSSAAKSVDAERGSVEFADGTIKHADLIVGADGLHSVVRGAVVRDPEHGKPVHTGQSAFRFLIKAQDLEALEAGRDLLALKRPGTTSFIDTKNPDADRHLIWYPCRNGTVHNFVGVHPTPSNNDSATVEEDSAQMVEEFAHFDPRIVHLLSHVKDAKRWPLFELKPLPSWSHGKAVIIGDAAHPMLPLGAQGANQGIEDGAVLGHVLANANSAADIPQRLQLFDQLRVKRASRVQILSSIRYSNESLVREKLEPYMEPGMEVPESFHARAMHDTGFDALAHCKRAMSEAGIH